MDLLRRLARAPGFVVPPTPSEDSIAMPPPAARPRGSGASTADGSTNLARAARDSVASSSTRSTMLVPGESVPGDLTRDSNLSNTLDDIDDSLPSGLESPDDRSQSRLSDIGIPRRASGVGLVRGGIFAAMADRPKTSRISTGSRVSFADQPSPSSMRFDEMSSRREDELERSLGQTEGGFVSASGIDLATERAIRRLDDLTRRSFFSDEGGLAFDDEDEEEGDESAIRRRKSLGRSMSEPLDGESSVVIFNDDDDMRSDEEVEVSDDLAALNDAPEEDDSDGLARRLAAEDSTSIPLGEVLDPSDAVGDDSRVSRVSFADQDEVSFQVDDAYSSGEDDVQYGLSSAQDDADSDSDDPSQPRLNLLDPKDLTSLLKRRITKKRKSRISPLTGAPLPPLPTSVMRDLFSSFLSPSSSSSGSLLSSSSSSSKKAKLDNSVMDELDSAAHDFFADFSSNLLAQAKTRSRTAGTITEADVVAVLKRQGRVTQRHDASSLAHRLLPRELTDQMELSRWAKTGTVQTTLAGMLGQRKGRGEEVDTTIGSSGSGGSEESQISG